NEERGSPSDRPRSDERDQDEQANREEDPGPDRTAEGLPRLLQGCRHDPTLPSQSLKWEPPSAWRRSVERGRPGGRPLWDPYPLRGTSGPAESRRQEVAGVTTEIDSQSSGVPSTCQRVLVKLVVSPLLSKLMVPSAPA